MKLIEDLPDDNKYLVVVAQQDGSIEDPKEDDLYSYGTLALVLKTFDMPDNSKSAIVQGVDRVKILKFNQGEPYGIHGRLIGVELELQPLIGLLMFQSITIDMVI